MAWNNRPLTALITGTAAVLLVTSGAGCLSESVGDNGHTPLGTENAPEELYISNRQNTTATVNITVYLEADPTQTIFSESLDLGPNESMHEDFTVDRTGTYVVTVETAGGKSERNDWEITYEDPETTMSIVVREDGTLSVVKVYV